MALVVDTHKHISNETEGRRYFPWQQRWHMSMSWAYSSIGGEDRGTPRNPEALYPRNGRDTLPNPPVGAAPPVNRPTRRCLDG